MTYIQNFNDVKVALPVCDHAPGARNPVLLVIEDDEQITGALQAICDFLDVALERIQSEDDVSLALQDYRPMGLIARTDCRGQDGCHIMMTVAQYDRSLPIMLLTGGDPALAGAADAVEELWKLESVVQSPTLPSVADTVDFLFRAGRKGRCIRFMPV